MSMGEEITPNVTSSIHPVVGLPTDKREGRVWEDTADGRRPRPIPDFKGPSSLRG